MILWKGNLNYNVTLLKRNVQWGLGLLLKRNMILNFKNGKMIRPKLNN